MASSTRPASSSILAAAHKEWVSPAAVYSWKAYRYSPRSRASRARRPRSSRPACAWKACHVAAERGTQRL